MDGTFQVEVILHVSLQNANIAHVSEILTYIIVVSKHFA